jgi:hypothetical protein
LEPAFCLSGEGGDGVAAGLGGEDVASDRTATIPKPSLASARDGDWRAADALITRVYGKPQEKLELSRQPNDFNLTKLSLEEPPNEEQDLG